MTSKSNCDECEGTGLVDCSTCLGDGFESTGCDCENWQDCECFCNNCGGVGLETCFNCEGLESGSNAKQTH